MFHTFDHVKHYCLLLHLPMLSILIYNTIRVQCRLRDSLIQYMYVCTLRIYQTFQKKFACQQKTNHMEYTTGILIEKFSIYNFILSVHMYNIKESRRRVLLLILLLFFLNLLIPGARIFKKIRKKKCKNRKMSHFSVIKINSKNV